MLDINGGELLVLVVLALVLLGPDRLPQYAVQLARLVRALRAGVADARQRAADELGLEASDIDWVQLDPRRYDPRRIVRNALLGDSTPTEHIWDLIARDGAPPAPHGAAYEPKVESPATENEEAS